MLLTTVSYPTGANLTGEISLRFSISLAPLLTTNPDQFSHPYEDGEMTCNNLIKFESNHCNI